MKKLMKFIFNIEHKGIYRITTILGIRITTKLLKVKDIEKMYVKMETYKIYSKLKNKSLKIK
ncbi:hypothetical protein [Brachyspira sp.]|uniref:hypothetical protein n=1 Tax=Brachyspira sp. TaxID=1977261 RepID=UPI003D7DB0E3